MATAARHSSLFAAPREDDQVVFARGTGIPSPHPPEAVAPAPGLPARSAPLAPRTTEMRWTEPGPRPGVPVPPDPTSST
jgi:hypothetical protein